MKRSSRKSIVLTSISIAFVLFGSFFLFKKDTHATVDNMTTAQGLEAFYQSLDSETKIQKGNTKKDLLVGFCKAAGINLQGFTNNTDANLYFAPKNSAFVDLICRPLTTNTFFQKNLLLDKTWSEIINNPLYDIVGNCNPKSSMNKCDFSKLLPQLFRSVMNDHSILGIGSLGLISDSDSSMSDIIKSFSDRYFNTVGTVCGGSEDYYLSNKSASNEKQALCSHPNTYNQLRQAIENMSKQQQHLSVFNPEKLKDLNNVKDCSSPQAKIDSLFACAYNASNLNDQAALQYNVWQNELLYYKLLITRVSSQMNQYPESFRPINLTDIPIDGEQNSTQGFSTEILRLQREVFLSEKAVTIMEKTVANFHATFPLHIAFLAYYEDLLQVRKSLTKIYTPIHQLYYKLRNVQEKQ